MLKEERLNHILKVLNHHDIVTYELLAQDLKVSEDTVRRDIEVLHRNGLLSKVRGGATLRSRNPLNFHDRSTYLTEGKDVIALKAQQFIKSGQTLFMDGGTTVCTVAAHFPLDANFRVVTNSQALIPLLAKFKGIEIIALGGLYNRTTETYIGAKTCKEAETYVADIYLMGTCAVDSKFGITAAIREDSEVKQAMIHSSMKTVALSNSEKLNHVDHFRVCNIKDIHTLVTDLNSNDIQLDAFRNMGIQLL